MYKRKLEIYHDYLISFGHVKFDDATYKYLSYNIKNLEINLYVKGKIIKIVFVQNKKLFKHKINEANMRLIDQ